MYLEEIVVSNMERSVPKHSLGRVDRRRHVESLEDVVRLESVSLEILNQILRGVAVISDHERIDLILLDQLRKPSVAVFIIDEVVSGRFEEPALDI